MDPKLQRRVQRYGWDKAADHYESFWKSQLAPAQEKLLEMTDLRRGERVLDVACGTGLVTIPASDAVAEEGEVVGTDISAKMVEAVREEAGRLGLENTVFERMGAESLTFPDDSFDAALCSLGLMYVPDPLAALAEMRRVLKAGGRAVSSVWGARSSCGWAEIFPIVDSRVQSEVCPLFFQLGAGDVLEQTYESAGYTKISVERVPTRLHYDSAEDACGAAFAGGPVALAYSRFDDETRDEAHREYLASIEAYRDGDRYAIPGEFVVVRGDP
jgi:ubiquinone/menaquinone biosynthesis C-methylase UbiE